MFETEILNLINNDKNILNLVKTDPDFPKYERLYNYEIKKNSGSKANIEKIFTEILNSAIDSKYKPRLNNFNN